MCECVCECVYICISLLALDEAGPLVNAREAVDNGINMSPITRNVLLTEDFL